MTNAFMEELTYESNALKQTHPTHLWQLATFYGLNPIPIAKARILELGCASGGNIIPMAYYYPQASFIGLDLSSSQINSGNRIIQDLSLKNIDLRCLSIIDFNEPMEKFDYIICHGLYSWVEKPIRNKILSICHENLSDNGIAYISYNTYPGWAIGSALRALMQYATQDCMTPKDKMYRLEWLFALFHQGLKEIPSKEAQLLNEELNIVSQHSVNQLMHEHLAPCHEPLHFCQFMEQAQRYQLGYICDATFFEDKVDVLTHQIQDYIQNRRFRSSVLCHQYHTKNPAFSASGIQDYYQHYFSPQEPAEISISQKPLANPLTRYQAQFQGHVTNPLHENILLTPVAQALMPYFDGQHDIPSLINIVYTMIQHGTLALLDKNQQPLTDKSEIAAKTQKICHDTLMLLAKRSLLVIDKHEK